MPRGDRRGPAGFGPMTGRGAGFCAGYPVPGYMNPAWRVWPRGAGYGFGPGFGRGRGWRWHAYATGLPYWVRGDPLFDPMAAYPAAELEPKYEAEILAQDAKILKEQLKQIEARLEELEKEEKEGED